MGDEGVGVAAVTACDRTDAGRQLGQVKGLDQVIVGAGIEPFDSVGHLIEGGQDDDGCGLAARPQASQKWQAPAIGQHQVQQDEVVRHPGYRRVGSVQALHPVHRMTIARDLVAHRSAQHGVIFNQQDSHSHLPCTCPRHGEPDGKLKCIRHLVQVQVMLAEHPHVIKDIGATP